MSKIQFGVKICLILSLALSVNSFAATENENIELQNQLKARLADDINAAKEQKSRREEIAAEMDRLIEELANLEKQREMCPVCLESLHIKKNLVSTSCNHIFCRDCISNLRGELCPLCRVGRCDVNARNFTYSPNQENAIVPSEAGNPPIEVRESLQQRNSVDILLERLVQFRISSEQSRRSSLLSVEQRRSAFGQGGFAPRQSAPIAAALDFEGIDPRLTEAGHSRGTRDSIIPILDEILPTLGEPRFASEPAREQETAVTENTRNRIVRLEAGHPLLRNFPEFAVLGDAWHFEDLNLILSAPAPYTMNFAEAKRFCSNLDRGRNLRTQLLGGGAKVPSIRKWNLIAQAMGKGTESGYQPGLIPGMRFEEMFSWSSTKVRFQEFASGFQGSTGETDGIFRTSQLTVRCIRSAGLN